MLILVHRTKFFMHGDYQLAYCPIIQIVSYAFRDGAFLNTALSPETIWRLRVPKRSSSLPLRWKPEILDTPLLRHVERTEYGYELHKSLPMTYDSSRQALRELGRDAKFEDDMGHYNYRRWTANEVNRTSLTCRNSALGDGNFLPLYLTYCSQGISPVRSGKGYSASLATGFSKSTTSPSISSAIFSMLSFSDRLRKVCSGSLGACSGNGIPSRRPLNLLRCSDVLFAKTPDSWSLGEQRES